MLIERAYNVQVDALAAYKVIVAFRFLFTQFSQLEIDSTDWQHAYEVISISIMLLYTCERIVNYVDTPLLSTCKFYKIQ